MKIYSYDVWHLSLPYPRTSMFIGAAKAPVTFSFFTLAADNNMRQRIAWFPVFETRGSAELSNVSRSALGQPLEMESWHREE